jgi:hypothetical protein
MEGPGTNVMILKIFWPKNGEKMAEKMSNKLAKMAEKMAEKMAFFTQNTASL